MVNIIGIDFGTTSCSVAIIRNGTAEVIANELGNRSTPSCVSFADSEILVGEPAQRQAMDNAANTIYDFKRLLGLKFSDPAVQEMVKEVPFTIAEGADNMPVIKMKLAKKEVQYTIAALVTILMARMKAVAEGYLGQECAHCVLSVPATFTQEQRNIYKTAATAAKLTVMKMINEPTAIAIAYGIDEESKDDKTVLVFDLGGRTCDVSLITSSGGMMVLKNSTRNTSLGGVDFDGILVSHFAAEFEKKNKLVIQGADGDVRAIKKLTMACERTKKILSREAVVNLECDSLFKGKDLFTTLSRAKLEQLTSDLHTQCLDAVKKVLDDAEASYGITKKDFTHVIVAGGMAQMAKIKESVVDLVKGAKVLEAIQQEEVVAYGCAVQAAIMSEDGVVTVAEKPHTVPTVAATVCIETEDGMAITVIPKGASLPCTKVIAVNAADDNQKDLFVQVYEGDRALCKHNTLVAQFVVKLAPKTIKSASTNNLSFTLSVDGSLSITPSTKTADGKTVIAVPSSSSSSTSSPSTAVPTDEQRIWDKAVLSWLTTKQEVVTYANSIINGMVKAGGLAKSDPKNTVGTMATNMVKDLTDTHKVMMTTEGKAGSLEKLTTAVAEARKKKDALAALIAEVLMAGMKKEEPKKVAAKAEESEEEESGEEESEEDLD